MKAEATFTFKTENSAAAIAELNRISNADKQLKAQVEKKPKGGGFGGLFESDRKVKNNLVGLVNDLRNVSNVSDLTSAAVVRLSETFKVGLGAGIGVGIGTVINRAINEYASGIDALSTKIEAFTNINPKGASEGELNSYIAEGTKLIQEQEAELAKLQKLKQLSLFIGGVPNLTGLALQKGHFEPLVEAREGTLAQKATEVDAARKQRDLLIRGKDEIAKMERNSILEASDAKAQGAEATAQGNGPGKVGELLAKIRAAEAEAARASKVVELLGSATMDAPQIEEAKAKQKIANNELRVAKAELLKFDNETVKAKQAELKYETLMLAAVRARSQGQDATATAIEKQAAMERDIAAAIKDGNTKLADRLRLANNLENKLSAISRLMNSDGTPKSQAQINREGRQARNQRSKEERALKRSNDRFGLTNVARDTGGEIISGIDPVTGERRTVSESDRAAFKETGILPQAERKISKVGGDFGTSFLPGRRDGYSGIPEIRKSRLASKAEREGMSIQSDFDRKKATEDRVRDSQDSATGIVTRILQVLSGWDSKGVQPEGAQ